MPASVHTVTVGPYWPIRPPITVPLCQARGGEATTASVPLQYSAFRVVHRPIPRAGPDGADTPAATVGLVSALGVPVLYNFVVRPVVADAIGPTGRDVVGFAVLWTLVGALVALTVVGERRPLSTIGLRRLPLRQFGLAVGIGVGLALYVLLAVLAIDALGFGASDVADVASTTAPWVVAAGVVTAAVTEETVFRGYALERLTERTGRLWIGALVSLAAFVAFHVPAWGAAHIVGVVVPLGAAITGLYLWKRSLPFVIVVHFVVDAPLVGITLAG